MARKIKILTAIVLIALVVVFVLQNREIVRVDFLIWSWAGSRALVLFSVFVVGALVGWLAGAAASRRRR